MNYTAPTNLYYTSAIVGTALLLAPTNIHGESYHARNNLTENRLSVEQLFAPTHYNAYKERLNAIANLPDNWDGFGAVSIDPSVYINANYFLSKLDNCFLDYLDEDDIYSTPYGTVVFDFIRNKELISIEIGECKVGFFTDLSNKNLNSKSAGEEFVSDSKIPSNLEDGLKTFLSIR